MDAFATVEDYEARYGDVDDTERITQLLWDASMFIAAQPGFILRSGDELQAANLVRVTCAVVHRALSAGDWAGLTNLSQSGGGYSASVTIANPTEDFYLTRADKQALGFAGVHVSRQTGEETEVLRNILSGGSLERNLDTDNPKFNTGADKTWVKNWCDYVYKQTGMKPLVYISASYRNLVSGIGDYGLWIAQYADNNTTGYRTRPGTKAHTPAPSANTLHTGESAATPATWT